MPKLYSKLAKNINSLAHYAKGTRLLKNDKIIIIKKLPQIVCIKF